VRNSRQAHQASTATGLTGRKQRSKARGRLMRIAVGVILPAPVGVLLILLVTSASSMPEIAASEFLELTAYAYLFVGIQSIVMSLLMELWINPQVDSNGFAVAVAAVLGAISLPSNVEAVSVGAGVGALVGGVMRWMWSRRDRGRTEKALLRGAADENTKRSDA